MPTEDIIVKIRTEVKELKGLVNLRQDLVRLKRVGGATNKQIQAMDQRLGQVNKAGKGVANVMGQFKFELLGILFFGMAVNRFLTGLLKPAFEVAGVFEILKDTLTEFFLPTASDVSDVLLSISEKFGELSPATQKFIGDLVLLISVLFLGLFIFATFGLGLASVQMAFGLTAAAAGLLFGKIILIGAVVIGLILLFKNWEKINSDLKAVIGLVALAIGLIGIAIGSPFIAALGLVSATVIGLIAIFKNWKAILESVIGLLNRIPGVNIGGITTAADVIRVSEEVIPPGFVPGGGFKIGDISPVVNVTITQPLDENAGDLGTEIGNIVNETIARGVGDLARR